MLQGVSTRKIFLYQALSLGLYYFYWCAKSRADVIRSANRPIIPSAWLLVVPGGNYWWMWRYANALDFVSYGRIKYTDTFLLYVVAINFTLFGSPFFRFVPDFHHSSPRQTITVLAVLLLVIVVTSIIGLGIFCAVMQDKVSKLSTSQP